MHIYANIFIGFYPGYLSIQEAVKANVQVKTHPIVDGGIESPGFYVERFGG
jgi:hypothetical protein